MNLHETVTVGIDLGGTSIRLGLFDTEMRLLQSHAMPTHVAAGPQAAVDAMAAALQGMMAAEAAEGKHHTVLGVGIGSPGPINLRTGVLGLLPNLHGWENFPLRDALQSAVNAPVILESDANAAAIAEWKLGAGQSSDFDTMVMVTLGTGVGSGLILHGKVWHGMFGMGGELGHTTVEPGGWLCGCGSYGCLEVYASAKGLIRLATVEAQRSEATEVFQALIAQAAFTPLQVAKLAETGDSSAARSYEQLGSYLGRGLANLVSTLDPPLIVVGGGVASAWDLFAPAMFRALRENSVVYRLVEPSQTMQAEPDRTFVRPALLGPVAGLLGAALLPRLALQREEHLNFASVA